MKNRSLTVAARIGFAAPLAFALLLATPAAAYYHYVHFMGTGSYVPVYEKFDLTALLENTVSVHVSDAAPKTTGNDSFASVLSQVKQAAAVWNSVSVSSLRVAFGGLEAANQPAGNTPGIEVEFTQLPPGVLAEAAPTVAVAPVTQEEEGYTFFPIAGSVVFLNSETSVPPGPSYAETYFTTTVHELGHALGLQHTFTSSAMSQQVVRNTTRTYPLGADDVAALALLYGSYGWNTAYGSISGQVTANSAGVALASVVALPAAGLPVSTLTNPDGTYEIDGLPPGQYMLYVHPLPPDANVTDPVDIDGNAIPPSGPFGTVFYADGGGGTLDPAQAAAIAIQAGTTVAGENFNVTPRAAVPIYDVVTYGFFDSISAGKTYSYSGNITVTPAFVNATQSLTYGVATVAIEQVTVGATTPVPQSAAILGGIGYAYYMKAYGSPQAVALYFNMPAAGASAGPQHLVLNFGDDIYVLPNAVVVVNNNPPLNLAVTANADGSATITGANLASDSRVFFDGLETAIAARFSGNPQSGSISVVPPPGFSGQKASVVVYNSDWQSSTTLDSTALAYGTALPDPPPTYAYPVSAPPAITAVPAALPGGIAARVDITATNMSFVSGQVTLGLGTSDAQVRNIFVLSPTHLVANVVTASNPASPASELSVISGFQVAAQENAFQTQPANPSAPYISSVANGIAGQATIYGDGYATIDGVNLGMARNSVQAAFTNPSSGNSVPALVVYGSENRINLLIPASAPAGLMNLVVNNGSAVSLPLAWGRFAPFSKSNTDFMFYALLYKLPYFSTIRNPAKFLNFLAWALVILFAYGIHGLSRNYLAPVAKSPAGPLAQLKLWWAKNDPFDRRWTWWCLGTFGASAIAGLVYYSRKEALVAPPQASVQPARYAAQPSSLARVFQSDSMVAWLNERPG